MKRSLVSLGALVVFVAMAAGSDLSKNGGTLRPNQMDAYAIEYLEQHQVLGPGEQLRVYYDVTLALDGTEAAMVTDQRVVYHKDGRNTSIALVDIVSVETSQEGLVGDIIDIRARDGAAIHIEIAHLNGGDLFISELEYARAAVQ